MYLSEIQRIKSKPPLLGFKDFVNINFYLESEMFTGMTLMSSCNNQESSFED